MRRILFLSMGILAVALGACAEETQIANPSDYEVVALVAD